MPELTHKQLKALENAPHRMTRRLVHTALSAIERRDSALDELRREQEQRASEQLDKDDRLLVVLHRDGFVEVYAHDWMPVRIVEMPSLGNEEEAEAFAMRRLPLPYRELYLEGRRIVAGNCKGCMDRTAYRLYQHEMALWEGFKQLEAEAGNLLPPCVAKDCSESPEQVQPVVAECSLNGSAERRGHGTEASDRDWSMPRAS